MAVALRRTPHLILGPYYPVARDATVGADLRRATPRALGEHIEVGGSVVDVEGKPVVSACVEIWQANAQGRYAHPCDTSRAPLDAGFAGHGRQHTDALGRFAFITVKPGAYPIGCDRVRAPHIHFEVTGRFERLVTQMFFEDEVLNAGDPLLRGLARPEALIAAWSSAEVPSSHPIMRRARWKIVMAVRGPAGRGAPEHIASPSLLRSWISEPRRRSG